MFSNSEELLSYISDEKVEYVDVRFCDLPGVMQHLTVPASTVDQDFLDNGVAFDGSSVRGFQAINESDMALFAGRGHGPPRPVPQAQDAEHQLLRARPDHRRALQPRPAQRRPQGRGVPGRLRRGRHLLLRRRGRVLHLRLGALQLRAARELPPHRLGRGLVEHRPRGGRRQPRLQGQLQGRLLPGAAGRPLRRPARRHGQQPDRQRLRASSAATTRWAPRARPRSTTGSTRCCTRPTT